MNADNMGELLDRYLYQVVPTKKPKTQESNKISIRRLKKVFDKTAIHQLEPKDAYKYMDLVSEKHGKTSSNRDYEVLSHCLSKAVEWGLIKVNPVKGQVRKQSIPPRKRYVTDDELTKALVFATPQLKLYIEFKLMTSLRRGDILRIKQEDITAEGIYIMTSKTEVPLIFNWTDDLRKIITEINNLQHKSSNYLFPNRKGECYQNDETGKANGFDSLWQRFMKKVVKSGVVRFQERDLRAKSASDDASLEAASSRLGHTEKGITKRVYRRKPEIVIPIKRFKT